MPIYPAGYQCCRWLCQLVSSCLLKGKIVVWGTSGITEMSLLCPQTAFDVRDESVSPGSVDLEYIYTDLQL